MSDPTTQALLMGRPEPYVDRLARVDDHIHAHLDEPLNLDELAQVACMSPFHWSRIYSVVRGEAVMASVRRLRLQRAADRLANSKTPIASVARKVCYGSVPAFSKAFSDAYGMAPGKYREKGSHALYRIAEDERNAGAFAVEIVRLEALPCASVRHEGPYIRIDQAMGRLVGALAQAGMLPDPPTMMATFFDDPDAELDRPLHSAACIALPQETVLPNGLKRTTLGGGDHARLLYRGPYADMKGAYTWLYGTWLLASGREAADSPTVEAYLNDPRTVAPRDLLTEIRLPLKPVT